MTEGERKRKRSARRFKRAREMEREKLTLDDHFSVQSTVGVGYVARVESDDVGGSVLHQGTRVGEGGLGDG